MTGSASGVTQSKTAAFIWGLDVGLGNNNILPSLENIYWISTMFQWKTGKPGMLQSMGSQRVRHNWVTEEDPCFRHCFCHWRFSSDPINKNLSFHGVYILVGKIIYKIKILCKIDYHVSAMEENKAKKRNRECQLLRCVIAKMWAVKVDKRVTWTKTWSGGG